MIFHTVEILKLIKLSKTIHEELTGDITVTKDEFTAHWRRYLQYTTSSIYGLHFSHCKLSLFDPLIIDINSLYNHITTYSSNFLLIWQEGQEIIRVTDLIWVVFVRLSSTQYISYVSLQSFMSIEQSVKEFSFVSYCPDERDASLSVHHYKSDFAHISDLYSFVIGLYKSEI